MEEVFWGEPFLLQLLPALFRPQLLLLFYQPSLVEAVVVAVEGPLQLQILSLQLPALLVAQAVLAVSLLLLFVEAVAEAVL